jgi:hypothetical protein
MRILFLNSSLEPGRDGVGDYVRLLADACTQLGHCCAAAALHDPFVAAPAHSTWVDGTISIRFPATSTWADRVRRLGDFRDSFHPDWISLQMVPFGFQKKGMLFGLRSIFRSLTVGAPLHIMFHELWVGSGRPSPLRFYLTGLLQSLGIRQLLKQVRPRLVTTSNPVYAAMLESLGVQAEILPLFGNVPIGKAGLLRLEKLLPEAGITEENRKDWWIGLFFGALHEQWQPEPFFSLLTRSALKAGKRICLVLVGRAGGGGNAIWNELQARYGREIAFVNRGEQSTEIISALLQEADFGIASSPWQLIGKSGTVAAMLDHGLPVIVTRDDFYSFYRPDQAPSNDPLLHLCDDKLEAKFLAGLPKRPTLARVHATASQLCRRLHDLHPTAP